MAAILLQVRGWFDVYPAEDSLSLLAPPSPSHSAAGMGKDTDNNSSKGVADSRPREAAAADNDNNNDNLRPRGEAQEGRQGDKNEKKGYRSNGGRAIGSSSSGRGGGGSIGALFLRMQLTIPNSNTSSSGSATSAAGTVTVTDEDRAASRALQVLLGEENMMGWHLQRGHGDKGAGAASTGPSAGTKGGSGGGGSGGGGAGRESDRTAVTVARLLGMPMGFMDTARDVQDTIGAVLDTVEVRKESTTLRRGRPVIFQRLARIGGRQRK